MTRLRIIALALAAALLLPAVVATPASAAAGVSITSALGASRASLSEPTPITVTGRGFQSIQGGFGGIYVLFGWVEDPGSGSWRPSNGGITGVNYLYVPDVEARDNAGYQRFVTFPGSGTAGAANGGELAADGTWSLEMVVPGPTFEARDRSGTWQSVDCREVTCGLITIGAHGVVNANNETFTPVQFVGSAAPDTGGTVGQETPGQDTTGDDGAQQPSNTGEEQDDDGPALTAGPVTVGVDRSTIIAGRVLGFTGRGFAPGEQVVATLGAGEAGAGPMVAGQFGEVAGALMLPADLRPGTHVLRLEGAGSGEVGQAEISVMADPASFAPEQPQQDAVWSWAFIAVVVAAAALLVLLLSSLVAAVLRRRREKKDVAQQREPEGLDAGQAPGVDDAADHAGDESMQEFLDALDTAGGTSAAQGTQTQDIPVGRSARREAGV